VELVAGRQAMNMLACTLPWCVDVIGVEKSPSFPLICFFLLFFFIYLFGWAHDFLIFTFFLWGWGVGGGEGILFA
jgi:hypothetical protein